MMAPCDVAARIMPAPFRILARELLLGAPPLPNADHATF